jgi:signal transduction histidine kinase
MTPNFFWLLAAIPAVGLFWGIASFLARLARLRSRKNPNPEMLLLGAVSERLRERGELAANLGELRTIHEKLLDSLPFGLLWVDQRGLIGELNQTGRELLGLKPGVVGIEAVFALAPFPWLTEGLASASYEPRRVTGPDERRWESRKIPAPNQIGALIQFVDVTDRENEERLQAIRDRFAELGEMTAGLAHQLKNGLAVIKGQGQLLERQGHKDAAMEISQEVSVMERLAMDFLRWAKPLSPDMTDTDLASVADEAISEIRRRPSGSMLLISRQGEGRAFADHALLKEALLNIIENACQASPMGGKVLVLVSDARIEIHDDGPGLEQGGLSRFLRPFESGRPDGVGLGLPLALKWLNAQGAELEAKERGGGGSIFVVKWQGKGHTV